MKEISHKSQNSVKRQLGILSGWQSRVGAGALRRTAGGRTELERPLRSLAVKTGPLQGSDLVN